MLLDLQFTDEARIYIEEQTISEVLLRYTLYDLATDNPLFFSSSPLFYHACRNSVVAPSLCRKIIAGAHTKSCIYKYHISNS